MTEEIDHLVASLKAAGEPTRLRLLALCAKGELSVSELTQIVAQSQPRVSRHLKLLCESGLLDRFAEGTSALYRLVQTGPHAALARHIVASLPRDDATLKRDLSRLDTVRQARSEVATAYFRANAGQWEKIRALYVAETDVETALLGLIGREMIGAYLDIGTGTGRILEVMAPRVNRGVGIDSSREMLAIARANLARSGIEHCQVRLGDMYSLPFPSATFDLATIHQVLHFADDPAAAVAEGSRILAPSGRLAVVDFLPHEVEDLRTQHAHRRLGFSDEEVAGWCRAAGLKRVSVKHLKGQSLTVGIWIAAKDKE